MQPEAGLDDQGATMTLLFKKRLYKCIYSVEDKNKKGFVQALSHTILRNRSFLNVDKCDKYISE